MNFIENEVRTISVAKIYNLSHFFETNINKPYKKLKEAYFPHEFMGMFCTIFDLFYNQFYDNYKSKYGYTLTSVTDDNIKNTWTVLMKAVERVNNSLKLVKDYCSYFNNTNHITNFSTFIQEYHEKALTPFQDNYTMLVRIIRILEKLDDILDVPASGYHRVLDHWCDTIIDNDIDSKTMMYEVDRYLPSGYHIND